MKLLNRFLLNFCNYTENKFWKDAGDQILLLQYNHMSSPNTPMNYNRSRLSISVMSLGIEPEGTCLLRLATLSEPENKR